MARICIIISAKTFLYFVFRLDNFHFFPHQHATLRGWRSNSIRHFGENAIFSVLLTRAENYSIQFFEEFQFSMTVSGPIVVGLNSPQLEASHERSRASV
jgi:hypothetical protein